MENTAHRKLSWLCIEPLGSPVVPEVYMMNNRSSPRAPVGGADALCASSKSS